MSDSGLRAVFVPKSWRVEPAAITRRMASMLAELESAGKADEVAHLGPGYPSPAVSTPIQDNDHFQAWLAFRAKLERTTDRQLLQRWRGYGPTQGPAEFRENFAQVYGNDFGGVIDPASLIPVIGATGGIDIVVSAASEFGGRVAIITDSPTYAGITARVRRSRNVRIFSVEMDAEGPNPDRFREAIREARAMGYFVPFYYTVADGHNPGGISFSAARRAAIYQILRDMDVMLVEDAPYTYISYEPEASRPKPFFAMDPDGLVIHIFTASKIWEPGKRVAYMHVPTRLLTEDKRNLKFRDILLSIASSQILFHDPENLAIFNALLHRRNPDNSFELGTLWERARQRVEIYGENRSILLEGLEHYLGGYRDRVSWTIPTAGFFVVMSFVDPPFITDSDFMAELIEQDKVTAIPMGDFYPDDAQWRDPTISDRSLRLAFSYTRSGYPDARRKEMATATERISAAIIRRLEEGKGVSKRPERLAVQEAMDVQAVFPLYNEARPSIDWSLADFFLQAVKINTASREGVDRRPSSPGQWRLAGIGASHLQQLGLTTSIDDKGNVVGLLESNLPADDPAKAHVPPYLLSAHLDTTSQVPFKDVRPHVVKNYQGENIRLPNGLTLTPENTPALKHCKGQTIIVTDGTTGLGADNKGGYAAILEAVRLLALDPSIPHGKVIVTFSTDEEVGGLDIPFGDAKVGSTHDLERPNLVTVDTFDAFNGSVAFRHAQPPLPSTREALISTVRIEGVVTHPGDAFGKMIHAPEVAAELVTALTRNRTTKGIKPVGIANDSDEQWMEISLALEPGNEDQAESLTAAIAAITAKYPGVKITQSRATELSTVDASVTPLIQSASAFIAGIPDKLRPQNSRGFQPYIWPAKLVVEADGSVSIKRILFRAFDRSVNEENIAVVKRDLTAIERAFPGVTTDMSTEVAYANMRSVIDQYPEVVAIVEAAIRANGLEPEHAPARGGTIGSNLALAHGIPAPNFGPGGFSEHSFTEGFSVEQGEKTARIIVDVLQGWVNRARRQVSETVATTPAEVEPGLAEEVGGRGRETEGEEISPGIGEGDAKGEPSLTGLVGPGPLTLAALTGMRGVGLPAVARAVIVL